MYSQRLQRLFSSKKINIGDRIRLGDREGTLMPRSNAGDQDTIVIKLDNGYNIGVQLKTRKLKKIANAAKWVGKEPGISFNKKNPTVSLIATGGTITSKIDYATGGVTTLTDPKEMMQGVPELAEFSTLRLSSPFNIMSESMIAKHWQDLAREVVKELKSSEGVVVTHGTDTLHFTAAALSFMISNLNKPVVLTGSQRSSDRGSSDAAMNLICSARMALSDIAAIGICMHASPNDDYCIFSRGTKVRKMHTSRRDAFRPINELPLARVWPDGKIQKMIHVKNRGEGTPKLDVGFEERVAIIKTYPGCDPAILDFYVDKGYRGIVLEVTGLGQVPTYGKNSWLKNIENATAQGLLVCGAAQTLYGRLNPNVYTEGRLTKASGLLSLEDMLPETAYVKLGWVLGHTKSMEKARKMMLTNYAGEISDRSLSETYLY
ncbi:MAG: Glu-tRNA(Gln) amidotransferase subunit GatD [Candidatus Aenigmatarchaeota archaeon]